MTLVFWCTVMMFVSTASSFFGTPFLITGTAIGFGAKAGLHPVLVGIIVSFGACVGSTLNQCFGQCYFRPREKKTKKAGKMSELNERFINWMLKIIEKYKKYTMLLVIIGTLTPLPEAMVLTTIGKDYPKWKMFITTLIVRAFNFSAFAWLGGSWVKEIIKFL